MDIDSSNVDFCYSLVAFPPVHLRGTPNRLGAYIEGNAITRFWRRYGAFHYVQVLRLDGVAKSNLAVLNQLRIGLEGDHTKPFAQIKIAIFAEVHTYIEN